MKKNKKTNKNLLLCAMLAFALTVSSCKEKNNATEPPEPCLCPNDYENLWEQPLETIQNCVIGKWKILNWRSISFVDASNQNVFSHQNSFVNITNDSVIFTFDDSDPNFEYSHWTEKFKYNWELRDDHRGFYPKIEAYILIAEIDYAEHQVEPGMVFYRKFNDTLIGALYDNTYSFFARLIRFVKIDGGEQ